ncbi:hypothetical protein [Spiroplasma sp. DGKH1]|uniref:hypothetical protein n=1 Tax=Spiroplasma sp. DGKH1 TaxID=3050074 RepID=UPI0034C5EBEA
MASNGESRSTKLKVQRQREIETKWNEIRQQAIVSSTPAMKRAIGRSMGDFYIKTAKDYRGKDGSAGAVMTNAKILMEKNPATATKKQPGKDKPVSKAQKSASKNKKSK